MANFYPATSINSVDTGSVQQIGDSISETLEVGDIAFVMDQTNSVFRIYKLIASTDDPSSPDLLSAGASYPDNRWHQVNFVITDHATQHTDGSDDIQDATASQKGLMTAAYAGKLDGIEAGADVTDANNVGSVLNASAAKSTPVDADTVALSDSASGGILKKLSWANIKAAIKGYLDAFFEPKFSKNTAFNKDFGTTFNTVCQGNDSRLSDARTPVSHASSHQHNGADEIATATPAANAIPKADSGGHLDAWIENLGIPETLIDAKGDLIVGTAADTAGRLAAGFDGQILALDSAQPGGMKWIHATGGGDMLSANNLADVDNAVTAFNNIKQAATTTTTGVVELATDGESNAGVVVQGNDSRLSDARTPVTHATSHVDGTDDIQLAASFQNGLMSASYASKLDGIEAGAEVNTVDSVNTKTGAVVLDPDDLDDTSSAHKFISDAELNKLAGIEANADVTDATNVAAAGALMASQNLSDLGNASTARSNLGLGSAATMTGPSGAIVGTTDTQTLSNKTLTQPALDGAPVEEIFTITDGSGVDLDPDNGTIQVWTLGASRAPTANNFANGQSMLLKVADGDAYTLDLATNIGVVWVGAAGSGGGSAPTLATSGYTMIELWKEGGTIYAALVGEVAS